MAYDLIAIGDPIIDTHVQIDDECAECRVLEHTAEMKICFDYGSKVPIVDSFQCLGGNAPNVAVGAKRLGMSSALISTVGGDANGKIALEELKKGGVNTDYVTTDLDSKTRYSIVLNYKAERTILSYSDKKTYAWPERPPAASWVYYTGLSEGFETVQEGLLAYLKKNQGVSLAVNPGSYMLKYAPEAIREMLPETDVLIANLEEAEKVAGITLKKAKSVAGLIRRIVSLGVREVAITDAERGAWAGDDNEAWQVAAFPVKVVAKTGAGDAFSAGYVAGRFYGHDIPHSLLWGSANSAGVIGSHGSQTGLLTKDGVEKMIQKYKIVQPKPLD